MKVLEIIEKEDGGCEVQLELEEEENNLLVGYAVNDILKKSIKKIDENKMQITLEESLELISKLQTKFNNSDQPEDRIVYVASIEEEVEDILYSMTEIKKDILYSMTEIRKKYTEIIDQVIGVE